ncbi:MAG: GvpL/GvpF family gas vesicle protein [Pseudoflavonifractor sp.]|nr:GvpL/GvpF family gas vesicle protein [Pseudoflavonifractor sp.]
MPQRFLLPLRVRHDRRHKDCAADMKSNRLLAKEMTGVDTPMVLNCAFLLDTENKDRFLQIVKALADENEKYGFRIEASGPWPPYSFCQ